MSVISITRYSWVYEFANIEEFIRGLEFQCNIRWKQNTIHFKAKLRNARKRNLNEIRFAAR